MKEKYREQLTLIITGFFIIALGIVFFFLIFWASSIRNAIVELIGILTPFVYGVVIAYLLKAPCNFFETQFRRLSRKIWKKERRGLCTGLAIAASFLAFFAVVYLLFIMMMPQLIQSVRRLQVTIPNFINMVQDWLDTLFADNPELLEFLGTSVEDMETTLRNWIQGVLLPYMNNIVSSFSASILKTFNIAYNLFIGVIAAVYIMSNRKRFCAQAKLVLYSFVKSEPADWVYQEVVYADKMFSGFLAGKVLDSTIIGILCFVACTLLQIPNTMLVSVIVGVTNIIPFFGPYIGGVPSFLIILMVSPVKSIWFLILICLLQNLDGNIIGPRILGNSTGLSGFWVLFSILLFSGLFGFAGMIIGVPLLAILYDIVRRAVTYGLKHHGKQELMEEYREQFHRPDEKKK